MQKHSILFVFCLLLLSAASGQEKKAVFPNGFHIGISGEGNIAQRLAIIACNDLTPPPESISTLGWKAGLELSYHFCHYFGFSIGIHYGSVAQFRQAPYINLSQYVENAEDGYYAFSGRRINRWQIPILFNLHYPIKNGNWILSFSAGANLLNVREAIWYSVNHLDLFSSLHEATWNTFHFDDFGNEEIAYTSELYRINENAYKVKADLLVKFGVCYRLPYADLIRLNCVFNYSFKDQIYGFYTYLDNSWGTISYRHNYLGLELSYIHCFKRKAKK